MEAVPGALGTSASLALRLGQTVFSAASLLFMCLDVEFYSYTSFSSTYCPSKICSRYQLSAAMAFMSWFLSFASTLFNLWLLPSL
uniref:CASP-like protein n=1 Tax=Gossypium raimondii TaxID=29730 RepID=A0A0D2SF11_GOSRA|nr:hypothetical protein B456_007G207900 [Gossypium raimondii]